MACLGCWKLSEVRDCDHVRFLKQKDKTLNAAEAGELGKLFDLISLKESNTRVPGWFVDMVALYCASCAGPGCSRAALPASSSLAVGGDC